MVENYTGKRLDGRYEITELLGVGGMAYVYKAYDNIDDRVVSVKILKEEYLANEEFRRRFKNESKAIAMLSHPNIVKVYNVSFGDKLQYIVMEYVDGITLKEYIEQQGKLETREAVHFTVQILRALQHAHDRGIVHRDIKPQNILLLSNGTIKVTDFGIARFTSGEPKTVTGSTVGSAHYISPEQARGETTDDKADIYSVGIVLYEMMTGRLPFDGDTLQRVLYKQLNEEPVRPREINPGVPIGLEQIAMHAMKKDTRERYQSAAEMLLDIEEFKRNPNVRFREEYYVDRAPTKNMPDTTLAVPASMITPGKAQTAPQQTSHSAKEQKQETVVINKRTPIIVGLIAGFMVVALIAFGLIYFKTDLLNGSKLTVPNLMGKNYATEIEGSDIYRDFNFEVDLVQKSTYEDGIVFDQDPRPGQKIDRKKTITLSVASTLKMVPVPDVEGMLFIEAKKILENKGFAVTPTPQTSSEVPFGTVISTSPEKNTEIEEGANVIIYYASDEQLIPVPQLIGWDVETAEALLKSVNLVLDQNIKYEDSESPEGEIIAQDIEKDTRVEVGTKIVITVSTGKPKTTAPAVNIANISIILPSRTVGRIARVNATLNGNEFYQGTEILDGSSITLNPSGTGSVNTVKVYADGVLFYSCQVDFLGTPAYISNENYYDQNSGFSQLPDVEGMSLGEARINLNNNGFTNITVQKMTVSNPDRDDVVVSQTPKSLGRRTPVAVSTEIILVVGEYTENGD